MLTVLAVTSLVYWAALAVAVSKTLRGVPPPPSAGERPSWPKVSIVIPARNEEGHIARALKSKLSDDFPNLEIVFVNDRSTDGTGRVADTVAREDARLKVVHLAELPPGWLGKVHAMQRGLEACTGDWVLFSDADVELAPGTLRRVVALAEDQALDHVTVLPRITGEGAFLQAALAAFFRVIVAGGRLWSVCDPASTAAAGVGAFNLVRRATFARTPGLEWLRMEIGDDMGLGLMVKRAGLRSTVLNGRDLINLDFYPSYSALARAVEKNGAAAPFPILVFANLLLIALEAGFLTGPPWLSLPGYALSATVSFRLSAWLGQPVWTAFVPGLGMLLLGSALIRSAVLALFRGGVLWRGTLYPTGEVRAGNRIGFVPSSKPPPVKKPG